MFEQSLPLEVSKSIPESLSLRPLDVRKSIRSPSRVGIKPGFYHKAQPGGFYGFYEDGFWGFYGFYVGFINLKVYH